MFLLQNLLSILAKSGDFAFLDSNHPDFPEILSVPRQFLHSNNQTLILKYEGISLTA